MRVQTGRTGPLQVGTLGTKSNVFPDPSRTCSPTTQSTPFRGIFVCVHSLLGPFTGVPCDVSREEKQTMRSKEVEGWNLLVLNPERAAALELKLCAPLRCRLLGDEGGNGQ